MRTRDETVAVVAIWNVFRDARAIGRSVGRSGDGQSLGDMITRLRRAVNQNRALLRSSRATEKRHLVSVHEEETDETPFLTNGCSRVDDAREPTCRDFLVYGSARIWYGYTCVTSRQPQSACPQRILHLLA